MKVEILVNSDTENKYFNLLFALYVFLIDLE